MSGSHTLPATIHTIPEVLAFWAETTPDAPALIIPGRPAITYAALWRSVTELAASLNGAVIGRHDRVVLLLPEGPALAIALLGTISAAVALPLSPSLCASELSGALHGFDAAAAIVTPTLSAAAREYLTGGGVSLCELHATADDGSTRVAMTFEAPGAPRVCALPRPEDLAFVSQTSGTTGRPKRVPRSHASILKGSRAHRDRFGLQPSDRALAVAPMTLALGRTAMMHGLAAGSALILPPAADLPALWAVIEQERPTWMHAPAGFLELLARYLRERPRLPPPSSFRFVRVTAAPIAVEICDELAWRLQAPILPAYSTSETGIVATALPPPARHAPGSAGRPVREIRIVDAAGNDVGPGDEGEIWIRPRAGFTGYLDAPETNAALFTPDGWFRIGDVGYLDQDGFLFLTGRVTDLINRGGEKISPAEVDAVLLAHPAVNAAATFAVPDERLGEDIAAAVVLADGQALSPRELRAWMLDRLAPHKAPRRIWFVADLPLTASGKVQRGVLRDRFLASRGAGASS